MNYLDLTTALLGLAYIILELRASRMMWVVGFVMQLLGIVLYYQKGLYADCGMELYYLGMTVYGFVVWSRKSQSASDIQQKDSQPIVSFFSSRHHFMVLLLLLGIFLVLWLTIYYILHSFTNSTVPVADSFTTALSVVGMWALAHKYLEQWIVWIAVDVVTCVLYFHKDIPFKASLYALYVVIAIFGYINWSRKQAAATTS